MRSLAILIGVTVVGLMLYIRLAPARLGQWHVDPFVVPLPARNGFLVRPDQKIEAVYAMPAAEVLQRFQDVALASDRTRLVFGSVDSGMMTFESRSRFWGFPDYTTVKALPLAQGQTSVAIFGRLRFGRSDFGVNRGRITGWLQAMQAP